MISMSFIVFYHVCNVNNEILTNTECAHVTLRDIHHCNVQHMYSHLTQHDDNGVTMILYVYDVTTQV